MEKDCQIIPFGALDKDRYLELYNHVFPKEMTVDFWNWLYEKSPSGNSYIETAWAGERLVGVYGIIAVIIYAGGTVIRGGYSVTAVTHPEYRYRGIFSALGTKLYSRALDSGMAVVYGFPTEHSRHGFRKNLGWESIRQGRVMLNSVPGHYFPEQGKFKIQILEFPGKVFDWLWGRIARGPLGNTAIVMRDSSFIEWRFFKHPEKKYIMVLAEDHLGPAGYMAVRVKAEGGTECCYLEDIVASDVHCFRQLINYTRNYMANDSIVKIIISKDSPYYSCAMGMGFRESGAGFYFGWKDLGNKNLRPNGGWYFTMADWADSME